MLEKRNKGITPVVLKQIFGIRNNFAHANKFSKFDNDRMINIEVSGYLRVVHARL